MSMLNNKREMIIVASGDLEIEIESIVNVPIEYVYKAHTSAELIPKWWGPAKYETTVEEMDVTPGGKWRYVQKDKDGNVHVFFGEFLDIQPFEKIVWTFRYEPYPDVAEETINFIKLNENQTKIKIRSVFPSKESRDGKLQSGMETGYSESLDRLEKINFNYFNPQKIKFCLWFDNQAEEAVKFYISLFKNSQILSFQKYGPNQPGPEGTVMAISFTLEGEEMMALNGGPIFKFTPAISMYITCDDQNEVDYLWNALTDGGKEDQCGWLVDKYGVSWQIVPKRFNFLIQNGSEEQKQKVMQELFKMKKIDVFKLEQAFNS